LGIAATGPIGGLISFNQNMANAPRAPFYLLNITVKLDAPSATGTYPVTVQFNGTAGFITLSGEQVQTYVQDTLDPPNDAQYVFNYHALVQPTASTGSIRLTLIQEPFTLLDIDSISVTVNQTLI
jgi:hypothetical protein